jgi:hypothetical protein
MPDTLSKECRPHTGLEVQAALWRDTIQSLRNKELAAHQRREVTLVEWAFGRSFLNIFVAICIPVPVLFPPVGPAVVALWLP